MFYSVDIVLAIYMYVHATLTCVAKWRVEGRLSKTIAKMMTVVRMAVSSTRAARSDKAHLTFCFFWLFFGRQTPFENPFSTAGSKLDPLMIVVALSTDIAAKCF